MQPSIPQEETMRSQLIFGAMTFVPNRYLLTKLAAKATRKLHRPGARIADTINLTCVRFSEANPMAVEPFPSSGSDVAAPLQPEISPFAESAELQLREHPASSAERIPSEFLRLEVDREILEEIYR
jgi:hypothetical protein